MNTGKRMENQRQLPGDSSPTPTAAAAGDFTRNSAQSTPAPTETDRSEEDDASVHEDEEGLALVSNVDNNGSDEKTVGDDDEDDIEMQEKNRLTMNIGMEDQRQLLPNASSPTSAAAAEDFTRHSALSTPQDRAEEDDASVLEEGLSLVSIGDDDYYDEKISFGDDDEEDTDDEDDIIKRWRQEQETTAGSTLASDYTQRKLPQDTFSFLIYSDVISLCFVWGIMVFIFQIAIYVVLAKNIIDRESKMNPVGFPINVTPPVRISEAIAILISIITQDDVRKAISLYRDGFDKDSKEGLSLFRGLTLWKWTLSIVLRATEGLLGLAITFLLIMRSSSVLDLLLNFSAIEFITQLDDMVFELALEGFLGRMLKKESMKLSRKFYSVSEENANSLCATIISIAYFLILVTAFFGGWAFIFFQQTNGKYLCAQIFSQLGDEALPMLGTFTGLFYRQTGKTTRFGGRSSYRGAGVDDQERGPLLAYCEDEMRWTLSLTEDGGVWNPCNWTAASSETKSFDLLSTTSSPWVIKTPTNRAAPLTHHFLMCYECTHVDDFCGDRGKCKKPVKREKFDQCICDDGYYGLRCEYSEPCKVVEAEGFSKEGGGQFTSKYYRLEGAKTYYHPVYTSLDSDSDESLSDGTDFIFFTGERWIMSYKYLFPDLEDVTDKKKLARYFSSEFHGNFSNYSAVYESEPVYFAKLLDADNKASPLSMKWRPYTGLQKDFIETKLSCAECNNATNKCLRGAVCHLNGTCGECPDDYSGSRCEVPPKSLSNGHCDPQYNNIKFDFDGGDCCDNKCRSTPENTCGKAGLGYIDTGYPWPQCGALNLWQLSAAAVYGVSSASRSGHVVALSGNGKVLAVADPGLSIVRLFDKDGAEWKQRGQYIQGSLDSHFGFVLDLSSNESNNIVHNLRTSPKVTLVVGAPKIGLVRVFTCFTGGCIQKGEDIIGSGQFGNSLSIDGDNIAIGRATRETVSQRAATNGEVKVFTWSNDTWKERGTVPIATPLPRTLSDSPYQFRLEGYYVSLSGDYLAVGTLEGKVSPGPRFESAKLITQVFKWNSTGWEKLGDEMEKTFYDDASFGAPWPLKSITIKGSILAVGSNSTVDVYSWNEASKVWIPREVELAKGPEGFVGWSVDLSEDASILAIGTNIENPQPTDKLIQMYQWDGARYNELSNAVFPGGTAASLSLSSDGNAVAVGLPYDSSNGGSTRVHNFYPESPCVDPSEQLLRISFTTDGNPQETSWELRVDSEVKLRSGPLSGHRYTTFVEEICVPAEACVNFRVLDTEGDGLNPPGVFALMLNGTEVARGGDFGAFKAYTYSTTSCAGAGEGYDTQPAIPAPTSSPTKTSTISTTTTSLSPTLYPSSRTKDPVTQRLRP